MILISAVLAISLLQMPVLTGQGTVKKIKIIINDKDGEKVVIDTIMTGENSVKTITLDGGKMIFISDGSSHKHSGEKHVTVTVTDDETVEKGTEHHVSSDVAVWTTKDDGNESSIDKTRFVVAKDGMVVTVEGENEEQAKELMKIIEEHLGVNKEEEVKQEKSEQKKNKK